VSDIEIRVDADEVTRALDNLDSKQSANAIKAAVRKAGQFLKPKVKAEAPKGPTGNLRKKVGSRVKRSRQRDGYYAAVRSFARHHHLVVQGTGDRFTKSGAFRGRMPANPYIDRAADAWENQAIDVAEQELARQLDLD
jgi:HK97 gp10 family phage protein